MAKKIVLNVFTGDFDYIDIESVDEKVADLDKIVTHRLNSAGHELEVYDSTTTSHVSLGPIIIVDNSGNVVSTQ